MTRPSGPRHLRCRRCASRKFRTPRDLAEHILYKHGRVTVYSQERSRPRLQSFCEDSPSWSTSAAVPVVNIRKRVRSSTRIRKRPSVRDSVCDSVRLRRDVSQSQRSQLVSTTLPAMPAPIVCQTVCTKPSEAVLASVPNRPALMLDFTQDLF